jgi:hypothetical protein
MHFLLGSAGAEENLWPGKNFIFDIFTSGTSGVYGTRTLDLAMLRQVIYHAATTNSH